MNNAQKFAIIFFLGMSVGALIAYSNQMVVTHTILWTKIQEGTKDELVSNEHT